MIKDLKHPFVSICIPVFNGENYISEAINSVLAQSYTNFELIIIDNCSTDLTEKIICGFNDKRITYKRNESNIGSIKNFNKCVGSASGEYFLLLPHDDLLLPGALKVFVNRLSDQKVGFVYSSILVIDEDGREVGRTVNHAEDKLFTSQNAVADIVNYFVPIQLAMTRTTLLKDLGGFDVQFGLFTDIHLWLRIIFKGWKTFYNHETLSCHRSHPQQGQKSFLESDIATASEHWGEELDRKFWIKNSYSIHFLKLLRFLLSEISANRYGIEEFENDLLKLFARSHLKSLLLALIRMKAFLLWQEFLIFRVFIKYFGFLKILLIYPSTLISMLKKKFSVNLLR